MTIEDRLQYTICFVHYGDRVLLLNRQKAPWMGRWNGVGGKLEAHETSYECILREVEEETGLYLPGKDRIKARGVMKWFRDGESLGGMYLFTAELKKEEYEIYQTPRNSDAGEGILDWKDKDWIFHEQNSGVVDNIKILLTKIFDSNEFAIFDTTYHENELISVIKKN
ncbi:hypothetical protein PACTADRAFT_33906 [Pachysolen tannophilus NRRL Y-2460]|uniref:Nudix hydrolase domain-containing protein n=1 Tax=Pachysolen tannophilus NRRL Y-2460 TaxID=669874 RepID=A0A1E4TUB2_PACTA|nr:hypothetical protein PACTADRAFT_33906 [Pachysolen tannophilus NRRL Y-2460]